MFKKLRRSRAALVGVCCALVGAAAVPVVGWAGITGSTGDGPMVLQSGLTTLAYSSRANVSGTITGEQAVWMRVGDTVHMTGVIAVTPTTAGATTAVYMSLPVDSNLNGGNCQGTASVSWPSVATGRVLSVSAVGHTHECYVEYQTQSTGLQYIYFSLNYRVMD
jgi:hypothetical protein